MENKHFFTSVINLDHLQQMFDSFHRLTNVPLSLVLPDGEVVLKRNKTYLGAGWQRACTDFHRKCHTSAQNCNVSDTYLSRQLVEGENYALYKCLNGMFDAAVPIKYNNHLIANLFAGQFFLKKPNEQFFRQNAKRYGYDEEEYLKAINEVEVFSMNKINDIISYLSAIALLIGDWLVESDVAKKDSEANRIANEIVNKSEKTNEIIASTILSLDSFVYSLDNNGCFENFISPFRVGFFGETAMDLQGIHYSEIVYDHFKNDFKTALENTSATGELSKFMFTTENNGNQYYHATVAKRLDRLNNIIGTTLHIEEVTDEVEALYEIEKLTVAVEQSPVSIVITNLKGKIEYVNNHFVESTGYSRSESIGKSSNLLKSGCQTNSFYSELWATILKGETWKGELINRRKDGTLFWEGTKISPVIINDSIKFFVAVKADITAQKKMEMALTSYKRRLEERVVTKTKNLKTAEYNYKELVEHLHGIVWEVDMDGFIKYISPNVKRYINTDVDELKGCHFRNLFNTEEQRYQADNLLTNINKRPTEFNGEEINITTERGQLYFNYSGKPIYDDRNKVIGFRGILIDITQQKERDKYIVEAIWEAEEKQKSFIAMELHDSIGSSLSAASIYMNTVVKMYQHDVVIQKVNEIIKSTAKEVRLIARQLRPPELDKLGLEGGLHNLKQLYESNAHIHIDLSVSKLAAAVLSPQLELAAYRIIAELINNSLKHGEASRIAIIVFEFRAILYILFEDNGIGGLEVSEKSYRTGMGISNIYSRVKSFNGHCSFFSIPNQGLVVDIQMKCANIVDNLN